MNEINNWIDLKYTLRILSLWAITSLIDSSFLALWIVIQWLVSTKVMTPLKLTGLNQIVLIVFQVMFSISTLSPVAITIYRDIRIMLLRTKRKIHQEIKVGEMYDSK